MKNVNAEKAVWAMYRDNVKLRAADLPLPKAALVLSAAKMMAGAGGGEALQKWTIGLAIKVSAAGAGCKGRSPTWHHTGVSLGGRGLVDPADQPPRVICRHYKHTSGAHILSLQPWSCCADCTHAQFRVSACWRP